MVTAGQTLLAVVWLTQLVSQLVSQLLDKKSCFK